MKFYQSGRSMVEMLGVLAIIGVLSVGAISGYSKAMMKYKLNKYANDLSMIFLNVSEIAKGKNDFTDWRALSTEQIKFLIPESFMRPDYKTSTSNFFDVMGNLWGLGSGGLFVRMGYKTSNSEAVYERDENAIKIVCPLIFQASKDAQIPKLLVYHPGGNFTVCNDKSCTTSYQELTVGKINDLCDVILNAQNGDAIMYFLF